MNDIEKKEQSYTGEIVDVDGGDFGMGDYVTRDGTDIQFVEEYEPGIMTVVCIVPPSDNWIQRAEVECNLPRRYSRINKHFLEFAKSEHEKLKQRYPDGWPDMLIRERIIEEKTKSSTDQSPACPDTNARTVP